MNADSTILVVDDDPNILSATVRLLEKDGYKVLDASTGEQALQSAKKHLPDLILLDNVLPDINGIEICRHLKDNKTTADIFISIVSGIKTNSSDKSNGLEIGADEYIARPISNRELLARIKAMFRLRNAKKKLQKHQTSR